MTEHPLIARLRAYAAASNSHDAAAAAAFFTPDGRITIGGETYQGYAALFAAHEFDRASETYVTLNDFRVADASVTCAFITESVFDRILGTGGIRGRAVFTFSDDHISEFVILPPDEDERQRVAPLMEPAIAWLREHHPDKVAQPPSFDYAGGAHVAELARFYAARE